MNKKQNVAYWDNIEQTIESVLINLAKQGGVHIQEIELDIVKNVTDYITNTLENNILNCKFPFIDEDF